MAKRVIIVSFVISLVIQWSVWNRHDFLDHSAWAEEAQHLQEGSPLAWQGGAYGYPGGPILTGTVAIRSITSASYYDSLSIFIVVFNAALIGMICGMIFLLRGDAWIAAAALILLSSDRTLPLSTPTTVCFALLGTLFALFSLYTVKQTASNRSLMYLWALIGGLMLSIRLDFGAIFFIFFFIYLAKETGLKNMLGPLLVSLVTFFFLDPFLWIAPATHIHDIIGRTFHQYAEEGDPSRLKISALLDYSFLGIIGIGFSINSLVKRSYDIFSKSFLATLIAITALFTLIFLTARTQEIRYFEPLILMWETILAFYLFDHSIIKNRSFLRVGLFILLVLRGATLFIF